MSISVVCNLNPKKITWANTFISCTMKNNVPIHFGEIPVNKNRLFIGDNIPFDRVNDNYLNLYFLAASSISPSDSCRDLDIQNETRNISWSHATLVTSNSEKTKISTKDNEEKIFVVGFPINIYLLLKVRKQTRKISNSVCFLGEIRPIKNFEFQKALILFLVRSNYLCVYMSPNTNKFKHELKLLGCQVVDNIKGFDYLRRVAQCEYFISTSYYESLCVSGIEASILGCKAIVPDHSGFKDWCPDQNRYSKYSLLEIIQIMKTANAIDINSKSILKYDSKYYFENLEKILSRIL